MSKQEKVLFVQTNGDGEFETESLWCTKEGNYYIVDNIPFVIKRISLGDTIKAEYDKDENAYYFDDFVSTSGNSTLRLFFSDEKLIEPTREALKALGCESEVLLARKVVAVNVPKEVEYSPVKAYLDKGEENGKWQYEESCLCHEY